MKIPYAWWRRLPPKLFARFRMRGDWDLRARENALYYIDCGHGQDSETFWQSGDSDVERLLLRGVEIGSNVTILEIGCGVGRLLKPFVGRASRIIGLDISREMVARARESLPSLPGIELHCNDGTLRPIEDETIDFVFSFIVFQHIPVKRAIQTYIREARRVLRPGGLFRFQVDGRATDVSVRPDSWNGVRFETAELASMITEARLRVLEITSPGTQYTWVTATRMPEGAEQGNRNVRYRQKMWQGEAIRALLGRLGLDPAANAGRLVRGEIGVRQLAEPFLESSRVLEPKAYVAAAYDLLLGRAADPEGLRFYASEIMSGIDRRNVVDCLISSAEFDDRYRVYADEESMRAGDPPASS